MERFSLPRMQTATLMGIANIGQRNHRHHEIGSFYSMGVLLSAMNEEVKPTIEDDLLVKVLHVVKS